jgi:hypothetical protein
LSAQYWVSKQKSRISLQIDIQYSNGNIKDAKWDLLREKFGAGEGGTSAGSAN